MKQDYQVIGGGLAGLAAANALADAGHRVTVFEQSERLGGRAISPEQKGYRMNLGPHALYRGGAALRILRDWKIPISGNIPALRAGSAFLVNAGELHPFPTSFSSLLTHPWFSVREKIEVMKAMRMFTAAQQPGEISMAQWIAEHARSERVSAFLRTLVRLTTFVADAENLSAARALEQLRKAFSDNVMYIDGGWQTVVEGLTNRAKSLGVEFCTRKQQETYKDRTVICVPPNEVETITGRSLPKLIPVRMACLTLGLRALPKGAARFALGVDQPLYLSVHSDWADVAPEGRVLVHLGKYLSGEGDDERDRAELESFADLTMRGWRDEAEVVQFLPNMTVSHGMPALGGRPEVDALGDGLSIAGDWVGNDSMLADAAISSGVKAAHATA